MLKSHSTENLDVRGHKAKYYFDRNPERSASFKKQQPKIYGFVIKNLDLIR